MLNLKLSELAAILGFEYPVDILFQKVAIDSRQVEKGFLFFALPGERTDGHHFLEGVSRKGAAGAVVSKSYVGSNFGMPLLFVDDTKRALQEFAAEIIRRRNPKILAITGSVGKTTTKEFLYTLVKGHRKVGRSPSSYNSQVGLPYAVLNASGDEELLILEMSMTEKGNLARLIEIAPPHIVLVTKIVLQHAVHFQGVQEIADAKAEIFTSKKLEKGICSMQSLEFETIQYGGGIPKISYGIDDPGAIYSLSSKGNDVVISERGGEEIAFSLPFEAKHLQENFLAALSAARALGLTWDEIKQNVSSLKPFKRRFESLWVQGTHVINDAYNMSPESIIYALQNLPKPTEKGKTIAVIGELKEMGKYAEECYRKISEEALPRIDHLLCYGKDSMFFVEAFKKEKKTVEWFEDKLLLKNRLFEIMTPSDIVLVKGSNSNRLWEVVE